MNSADTRNSLRLSALAFGLCAMASLWIAAPASFSALQSGCGADSGCGQVTSSSWAFLGPIPVSWLGVGVYGLECLALLAALAQPAWHHPIKRLLAFLIGTNLAAAIYFTGVQVWGLGTWCPWCCTIHALACLGSAFTYRAFRADRIRGPHRSATPLSRLGRILAGTVGQLVLLIGLSKTLAQSPAAPVTQSVPAPEMAADEPSLITLHGGKFQFDLRDVPLLGKPDAGHRIFAIADPTCGYCREAMQILDEALQTMPEKTLAVVCLPGTRESTVGDALQTLLLTLWREKPREWTRVVREIDAGTLPPDPDALRGAVSAALGGEEALAKALARHQAWSSDLIKKTRALMSENARLANRELSLPQLQSGGQLLFGAPTSTMDLDHLTAGAISWPDSLKTLQRSTGPDASDPCRSRRFCGNLRIIFNGAGENLSTDPKGPGVDPAAKDTVQFLDSITHSKAKNTKVIVFSSDKTQAVATSISQAKKKLGKAFLHLPTSKVSFERYLQNDAELEALKQSFMTDPDCAEMVKPGEDLSRYIKVDVFIASHSEKDAKGNIVLPVWPTDIDSGEDDKFREIHSLAKQSGTSNPSTYVESSDFEQLRKKFSASVFHALPITCDGTAVAELIVPSESGYCGCYAAYTDVGTISVRSPFDPTGVLDQAIPEHGSKSTKANTLYSLETFSIPMLAYNRLRNFGDESGDAPIFDVETDKANHFDLFSVRSDEKYADSINGTLARLSPPNDPTKLIVSDPEFESAYREVSALISEKEIQNHRYLSGLQRDPNMLKETLSKARDFFNKCFFEDNHTSKNCIEMRRFREVIFKNSTDGVYRDAAIHFNDLINQVRPLKGSGLLVGKNNSPIDHYKEFSEYWKKYLSFHQALSSAAREMGVLQDIAPALDEMRTKFATFYAAYIHAYFPDIVKDSLDRRVEKVRQAADGLRAHYAQTHDPKYKQQLQRLRTHLACTLNFPFGPNYREVNDSSRSQDPPDQPRKDRPNKKSGQKPPR